MLAQAFLKYCPDLLSIFKGAFKMWLCSYKAVRITMNVLMLYILACCKVLLLIYELTKYYGII